MTRYTPEEKNEVVLLGLKRPCSVFGESGEGHPRFSFAPSMDKINAGMNRIEEAVMML